MKFLKTFFKKRLTNISIILAFTISSLAISALPAHSFNLNKELSKIKSKSKSIDKDLGNIEEKISQIAKKELEKITDDIDKYKEKIAKEERRIKKVIDDVEGEIQKAKELKAKAQKYISLAKTIAIVLSTGIIAIIFAIWRIWKNIVKIRKAATAAINYKDVIKRIEKLENEAAKRA